MDFGIVTYGAIAAICYAIGYILKSMDKILDEYIPAIVLLSGIVLGIVSLLIKVPDFPANDIINAMAVGAVSGAAAIAANQVAKQIGKHNDMLDNLSNNGGDENEQQ